MKLKSINKTQFKIIYEMYNSNQNSKLITNSLQIDQAAKLAETWPNEFICNRMSHQEYSFHIVNLGKILDLIKYNQKFEKEI